MNFKKMYIIILSFLLIFITVNSFYETHAEEKINIKFLDFLLSEQEVTNYSLKTQDAGRSTQDAGCAILFPDPCSLFPDPCSLFPESCALHLRWSFGGQVRLASILISSRTQDGYLSV